MPDSGATWKRNRTATLFISDQKRLPDRDLLEAVVCLANSDGGDIYLGVENDGTPNRPAPGAYESYRYGGNDCQPDHSAHQRPGGTYRYKRPPCRKNFSSPFGSTGFNSRRSTDLGLLDYSAMPVENTTTDDFDPLERERLRQMIDRFGGDRSLLGLADGEMDGALGFVTRIDDRLVPTLAGILILGRAQVLREKVPTHETAFQVLEDTNIKVNDFYRMPILKSFERIMEQFETRIEEEEIQEGLFRVPVPNYEKRAFREPFVNALIHRDYSRMGAVYGHMGKDGLVISNPGGFIEGVTLENLLVVEPKPRNPLLADIVKRIGLTERTGRGVDLIFYGMLRYGRPAPDYSGSDLKRVERIR